MLNLKSNDDGSTPEKKKRRLTGHHNRNTPAKREEMETIFKVCISKEQYVCTTTSIIKLDLLEIPVRFMHGCRQQLLAHNRLPLGRALERAAKIIWLRAQAEICTGR